MPDEIRHLTDQSDHYPSLLREISQAPTDLYIRGNIKLLNQEPILAVVGSRYPNTYGKRCIAKLLKPIVQAGVPIISGLAYGIDSLAHKICLENDSPTIAVLGSGIDDASIYPRAHIGLAHDIIAQDGVVISEYPPGTPSFKGHFPARNRIVAGLAQAILIVQAHERSGSLITARLGLEGNRDVCAVPGPITDKLSAGTNRLIQQGAAPILASDDLFHALKIDPPTVTTTDPAHKLTADQKSIVAALTDEPVHIDQLAEKLNQPSSVISVTLIELELQNVVTNTGGNKYLKK